MSRIPASVRTRPLARPFLLLVTGVCLACPALMIAQMQDARRALAIEDYYGMKNVGAPVMSGDGRWVAFDVTTRVEATNGTDSEVWLVPTDGSAAARRVSPAGVFANAPGWLDDGRLRFNAAGHAATVDPAEPDRIDSTAVAAPAGTGARGGRGGRGRGRSVGTVSLHSPDGQWVATLRDLPYQKAPKPQLTDFEERHERYFKGVEFDYLPFHQDGGPFPLPNYNDPDVTPPEDIFLAPAASGTDRAAERRLTSLGLEPEGLQWSPDGKTLLFTADSAFHNERSYGRSEIWTVTVDGKLTRLTPNREFRYNGARYSPDGRWILTTRALADDWIIGNHLDHGGATDLVIIPAGGGREINLTANWDYIPAGPFWSLDSKYVCFTGGIGGTTHLFRVPVDGGPVEQITKGQRRLGAFSYDRGLTKVAYTVGLMDTPTEIYVANIDGSGERQLTHVLEPFTREVALGKTDRLRFKSPDGTPIEGWITYPYNYRPGGGPYPLIVASHGGPHSADEYGFNFKNQYLAANGYFVLEVNFRSSTGYGEKFLWATWGAWGTKDGQDVMAGVDYAISKYPIDARRVGAMGHSYGGFMTNWLITHYPDRFAAAIPGAGIANWTSDYGNSDIPITKEKEFWGGPWNPKALATMIRQSPLMSANRVKAATLFIIGEVDQRVPYSETQQMYVALKKAGVPAKVIMYAGQPHGIAGNWNNVHRMLNERRWMDTYLKGAGVSQASK